MHLASWSLAAFVAVAALLLTQSAEVAGKADKSLETSSLEDELESSLPQPPQPQLQLQQPQQSEEQMVKAAKVPQVPKQHHQSPQQQPHHLEQQLERQKSDKPERQQNTRGHRPSREELREMFRELLESMSEAERKSLTLRLGRDSVKRTFSKMRDEVRAEASTASVTKRAMPQEQQSALSHAKALRMRRSLLMGSMESGMSATRQRRKKRDLVDYSPEEYAQLVAMLAANRPKYIEDAEGNIRLEGDDDEDIGVAEDATADADEQKRRTDDDTNEEADIEERRPAEETHGVSEVDTYEDVDKREYDDGNNDDDADRSGVKIALDDAAEAPEPPPLPLPAPPAPLEPSGEREPLTMFLVRMAGEKGLFVPLDQTRAQRLAVELAGEVAVAEVAEAQAAVEAAARDAAAAANAEAEANAERARQEAGVAELKRFAEKLARRIPPGF